MPERVMVLAPAFVKLKAPLTTPPKVIEPVPPIVLLLPKVIALFAVMLVPVAVNAPLDTPAPLIVIAFVLARVPLLKLKSNVAPEVTLVLVVEPKPLVEAMLNVPALTDVVPE